jgi:hypothetical protein
LDGTPGKSAKDSVSNWQTCGSKYYDFFLNVGTQLTVEI